MPTYIAFFLALIMLIAALFQWITLRTCHMAEYPTARAGKRIMLVGFIVAFFRYADACFSSFDLLNWHIGLIAFMLVAIGSIAMSLDRVCCRLETKRQLKQTNKEYEHAHSASA